MTTFQQSTTYDSLIALCADGPAADRAIAAQLLARELRARLDATDRDFRGMLAGTPTHPAWTLASSHGGPYVARYFRSRRTDPTANGGAGTIPGGGSTAYPAVLSGVQSEASALIAATEMAPAMLAASLNGALGRFDIVADWVAASGVCPMVAREKQIGFSLISNALEVVSGSYVVRFEGHAQSAAETSSVNVILQLAVSGTPVETHTVVRDSDSPLEIVDFSFEDEVEIDGPLTFINGSPTHNQFTYGLLRIWPA